MNIKKILTSSVGSDKAAFGYTSHQQKLGIVEYLLEIEEDL